MTEISLQTKIRLSEYAGKKMPGRHDYTVEEIICDLLMRAGF